MLLFNIQIILNQVNLILVPKDGSDYTDERLEMYNVQYFTGDGSTLTFTLNATGMTAEGLAVFL